MTDPEVPEVSDKNTFNGSKWIMRHVQITMCIWYCSVYLKPGGLQTQYYKYKYPGHDALFSGHFEILFNQAKDNGESVRVVKNIYIVSSHKKPLYTGHKHAVVCVRKSILSLKGLHFTHISRSDRAYILFGRYCSERFHPLLPLQTRQ